MENKKRHYIWLFGLVILSVLVLYYNKIKLGLDLRGGTSIVLQAQGKIENDTMEKVRDIIERRINSLGVSEPVIQLSGNDKLIVELAGVKDPEKAKSLIGTTAKLEFKIKEANDMATRLWYSISNSLMLANLRCRCLSMYSLS